MKRFLKKKDSGEVFQWSEGIAKRKDMIEVREDGTEIRLESVLVVRGQEFPGSVDQSVERVVLAGLRQLVDAGEKVRADDDDLPRLLLKHQFAGRYEFDQLRAAVDRLIARNEIETVEVVV